METHTLEERISAIEDIIQSIVENTGIVEDLPDTDEARIYNYIQKRTNYS